MASLDTSVFVDLRGRDPALDGRARRRIAALQVAGQSLVTTRINVAELYVGISRSRDSQEEERQVRGLLGDMQVLEFDERAARLYGSIVADLWRKGTPIGDMDALVAATALAAGHSVVTRDVEHFSRIQGLVVETY